ncbi:class I SAM-dependent methyltransferase [Deinococcus multiflagellatus]|uniref:Class I SAM-dependent methyltransferase n=1 Tax=Deinococcus multiflagellatus TaxID=1656887 RepID=A0ABW1ZQW6_9DEIO|nr:class I SAM-dependent methyltransferase [Deinococcus multiflagellatus]MBZ9715843.1 class I SAM-dependent methyltransferase [Deinococcus multiflagellatus]
MTPLASDLHAVLSSATRSGAQALELHLPPLDPDLYARLKDVLQRLSARWVKRRECHVFDGSRKEGEGRLDEALATRLLPDRNPLAFFPTPPPLADQVARLVSEAIGWASGIRSLRILEPHGGEGALLTALERCLPSPHGFEINVCELDPVRAQRLQAGGWTVVHDDYLTFQPTALYDVILANPPFSVPGDKQAWQTHLRRCWHHLAVDGLLVAILPASALARQGTFFEETRGFPVSLQTNAPGSFKASGTEVATVTLTFWKEDQSWKRRPFNASGTLYPSWHAFQALLTFENDQAYYLAAERLEAKWRGGQDIRADLQTLYSRLCRDLQKIDVDLELLDEDHAYLYQAFIERRQASWLGAPCPELPAAIRPVELVPLQRDRGNQPALL